MKLTKTFLVFLTMSLTASCATGNECAWAKRILVSDADVITRATAVQIVAHNRKVVTFCR